MIEEENKPGWGDLMEDEELDDMPPMNEFIEDDIKTIIEFKRNDEGKKIKITRTYKLENRKVPKSIAKRKLWKKFGEAKRDNPHGPDPSTTYVAEDVFLKFVFNKEEAATQDDDPLKKLQGAKIVKCRVCKGDHWTTKCPYKDSLQPLQQKEQEEKAAAAAASKDAPRPTAQPAAAGGAPTKYVPPSLRGGDGTPRRGESMQTRRNTDEAATVRVTNLSEDTQESDLQELFRPFGQIARIYLAKDKITNQSKGFAFISYLRRDDAARAIKALQGFGYDHLILNVEWARPSVNN
eukprot:Seg1988.4 transcript_id=Seg1988.4/GoldUCD/mRNA.D3Y31 product="Eukaryotic translation initiation factor 3 subunit G" protein_id=Seg1988.4/GoldUCD/D3Y31